jgi:hypothetical protein
VNEKWTDVPRWRRKDVPARVIEVAARSDFRVIDPRAGGANARAGYVKKIFATKWCPRLLAAANTSD